LKIKGLISQPSVTLEQQVYGDRHLIYGTIVKVSNLVLGVVQEFPAVVEKTQS
jgi:hypothetical protein